VPNLWLREGKNPNENLVEGGGRKIPDPFLMFCFQTKLAIFLQLS
jgi:hypothetical protein